MIERCIFKHVEAARWEFNLRDKEHDVVKFKDHLERK